MRAVLLGMNNPLSSDPRHALFPHPPGCTGHRIFTMLSERVPGLTRGQYLHGFDRRNLVVSKRWSRSAAEAVVAGYERDWQGRTVLVLGDEPRRALGLPRVLIRAVEHRGVNYRMIPHPSGRCLWYNDPQCRALAALLLEELYDMREETRCES